MWTLNDVQKGVWTSEMASDTICWDHTDSISGFVAAFFPLVHLYLLLTINMLSPHPTISLSFISCQFNLKKKKKTYSLYTPGFFILFFPVYYLSFIPALTSFHLTFISTSLPLLPSSGRGKSVALLPPPQSYINQMQPMSARAPSYFL